MFTNRDVLAITDIKEVTQLRREDFRHRLLNQDAITHLLKLTDALWVHSGERTAPHAELTSGKCSNGFIDTLRALTYTNLSQIFAEQLLTLVRLLYTDRVDWVVGSDHAGAAFSKDVANLLGCRHDFTEKGEGKTQLWIRQVIEPGEIVLQIEELITTTGTMAAVRKGIEQGNHHPVVFAPVTGVFINRYRQNPSFAGFPIVYGAYYDIWSSLPEDCDLCKAGSPRVRPKQNWATLTQRA